MSSLFTHTITNNNTKPHFIHYQVVYNSEQNSWLWFKPSWTPKTWDGTMNNHTIRKPSIIFTQEHTRFFKQHQKQQTSNPITQSMKFMACKYNIMRAGLIIITFIIQFTNIWTPPNLNSFASNCRLWGFFFDSLDHLALSPNFAPTNTQFSLPPIWIRVLSLMQQKSPKSPLCSLR